MTYLDNGSRYIYNTFKWWHYILSKVTLYLSRHSREDIYIFICCLVTLLGSRNVHLVYDIQWDVALIHKPWPHTHGRNPSWQRQSFRYLIDSNVTIACVNLHTFGGLSKSFQNAKVFPWSGSSWGRQLCRKQLHRELIQHCHTLPVVQMLHWCATAKAACEKARSNLSILDRQSDYKGVRMD